MIGLEWGLPFKLLPMPLGHRTHSEWQDVGCLGVAGGGMAEGAAGPGVCFQEQVAYPLCGQKPEVQPAPVPFLFWHSD